MTTFRFTVGFPLLIVLSLWWWIVVARLSARIVLYRWNWARVQRRNARSSRPLYVKRNYLCLLWHLHSVRLCVCMCVCVGFLPLSPTFPVITPCLQESSCIQIVQSLYKEAIVQRSFWRLTHSSVYTTAVIVVQLSWCTCTNTYQLYDGLACLVKALIGYNWKAFLLGNELCLCA